MKNPIRHILLPLIALFLAGSLVYVTIVFWKDNVTKTNPDTTKSIVFSFPHVVSGDEKDSDTISYENFDPNSNPGTQIFHANFARLSSAIFLPYEGFTTPVDAVSRSGSEITVKNVRGIFSWYDPFASYTIMDGEGAYSISQITNGSVYVGREADGTVSIYSIDLVADLTFLHEWNAMTKMIIFPGMYVRFDPKNNAVLRGADLFRIMLALKNEDTTVSTGIEFVDPRVNTNQDGKDVFFMYRLPIETRPLFQMLHTIFRDRVHQVDLLKEYRKSNTAFATSKTATNILNPTKNTYRILGDLQLLFSNAVSDEMSPQAFRTEAERIIALSQQYQFNDEVNTEIEDFLINGRFALYLDVQNTQYQFLYNEAASIVGIAPTTGRGRLFQALSNIFSRNLLQDNATTSQTNTYILATNELKNTLSLEEMETSDYFDLSLYAYLIFQKMTDGKVIQQNVLETDTLYQLYTTIFQATQRYVNGITDASLRSTAQRSLVVHFYEPMVTLLVNSLYSVYATNTDGTIDVSQRFLDRDGPKFSLTFAKNIETTYVTINEIFKKISGLYSQNDDVHTRDMLQSNLVRLDAFVRMIDKTNYKEYKKNPYRAQSESSSLPQVNATRSAVVRTTNTASTQDSPPSPVITDGDGKDILQTATILARFLNINTIPVENIKKTTDGYQVTLPVDSGTTVQFLYNQSTMSMQNIVVNASNIPQIRVLDVLPITNFRLFLSSLSAYEQRIADIYTTNPDLPRATVIMLFSRNQVQIGNNPFTLMSE